MTKNKFQNGLDAAMKAKGLGPTELGRRIGQTKQNVDRWRNGERKLPVEMAAKIAPILGVTSSALLLLDEAKDDLRRVSIEEEWLEERDANEEAHKAYSRENYRPRVAGAVPEIDVELGAGEGRIGEVLSIPVGSESYSGHRIVDEWLLPEAYFDRVLDARSGNTIVMPVVGDSMTPTYSPGDRVLIDLTQDRLTIDTVYAISDGYSPPQIKRLQRVMFSQPPEVQVISDNAAHTPQTVPLGALRIIGRVIGVVAKR